ncbi:unnamed protein product [Clonostachys rosea f. rosea IK726]|uniref:Amino acid transporter transmembrane domain-containing protein n=2 Tax=Bionectria ochroleuca TaxID=29856 RepID=A0A0B7K8D6_BIOOC|nr:unnamed protein product [Clonostachys rosea f. rosea IK726]
MKKSSLSGNESPRGNEDVEEVVGDNQNVDAVFGQIREGGPNYRNVGWLGTSVLMMKTQIGLGVLSFPVVFDTLGMIPGVILMLTISGMTLWSNYMVGVFKLNHPDVYGLDDVGERIFGRIGREIFGVIFVLFQVFTAGSAVISVSIALNALSMHATCTAVFVAVAAIASFCLSSIRTLGRISWLAWVGVSCIIVAVLTVTVAVGLQDRPSDAPKEGVWKSDYVLFANPSFTDAISAISTIIFSYAGTGAFFPIVSEMRDPGQYNKALFLCHSIVTIIYVTVGVVVYYYCGSYVASPALGSAGPLIKKVAYGIALPGLMMSAILLSHLASKYMFVRILRGTHHMTSNTLVHWSTWLGATFSIALVAYLLASGIPIFGGLVSLAGALLGTFMSFQPMGCMWLYDNWSKGKENPSLKWRLMVFWSVFMVVIGSFLMIAGTYGSIVGIIDSFKASGGSKAWSCADNSNSV